MLTNLGVTPRAEDAVDADCRTHLDLQVRVAKVRFRHIRERKRRAGDVLQEPLPAAIGDKKVFPDIARPDAAVSQQPHQPLQLRISETLHAA